MLMGVFGAFTGRTVLGFTKICPHKILDTVLIDLYQMEVNA